MITVLGISSIVLNILLLAFASWMLYKLYEEKKQVKRLLKEIESDSLEHYLKQIKKKGFEVTVKPRKEKK